MPRITFTKREIDLLELEFSMATEAPEDGPIEDIPVIKSIQEKLTLAKLRAAKS